MDPRFLDEQGLPVLFAVVLVKQLGLPFPATPILLAIGAMAGADRFPFAAALAVAVAACVLADYAWYVLGRWRGAQVLALLCRIAIEPDSCVRTAENRLAGGGARALVIAKFVPGLSTAAPPVAGLIGMRVSRFLLFDGIGSALWCGVYLGLGWLFADEVGRALAALADLGTRAIAAGAVALAAYLALKVAERRRFLRAIALDRITPEELHARIAAGEDVVVVDLRHSAEFEAEEATLPRAWRVAPESIDDAIASVPADREVVLFCT